MPHYVSLINGMSNAQADDLMSFATDLLDGSSGIVAATDYAVAQSSPVAMSVAVGTGKAYIYISSLLSYYRTILDAAAVLSIASNSSGSDRIDLICIKIDTGATPDADASNIATVVVVQGTPGAGAPSTPANHYKLAQVTVVNGAVSIVTANIADSRSQLNIRTGTTVGGITPGEATDAGITFTDVTTNNASVSKHGFLKKLSNVATEFMNGVGNWVSLIKGAGSDVTDGVDDAKYLTSKTLADAHVPNGKQIATPSNPSSGYNKLYFKSDEKLYKLTSAGVEAEVGGALSDKAAGSDITTGTDDAKYVTSKAMADADINSRLKTKIVTATRDLAAVGAPTDVTYSGVGFKPTAIVAVYGIDSGVIAGFGVADSAKSATNVDRDGADATHANNYIVCAITSGSNHQLATVKSYDADGFTLTWTKSGTPTGTLNMYFLCFR